MQRVAVQAQILFRVITAEYRLHIALSCISLSECHNQIGPAAGRKTRLQDLLTAFEQRSTSHLFTCSTLRLPPPHVRRRRPRPSLGQWPNRRRRSAGGHPRGRRGRLGSFRTRRTEDRQTTTDGRRDGRPDRDLPSLSSLARSTNRRVGSLGSMLLRSALVGDS